LFNSYFTMKLLIECFLLFIYVLVYAPFLHYQLYPGFVVGSWNATFNWLYRLLVMHYYVAVWIQYGWYLSFMFLLIVLTVDAFMYALSGACHVRIYVFIMFVCPPVWKCLNCYVVLCLLCRITLRLDYFVVGWLNGGQWSECSLIVCYAV